MSLKPETALAVIQPKRTDLGVLINESQIDLLKRTICKDASNDELQLFIHVCKHTGLDPFARQIYAIKRGGIMTIMVSIDGARLVAKRTGKYQGQQGPYWCGDDGVWKEVWLSDDYPRAAKVGVWMEGFKEPLWGVATMESYAQKDAMGKPSNMWKKMPDVMIAKCAEMLALRKAAPNELSGLYSEEELQAQPESKANVPIEQRITMDMPGPDDGVRDTDSYKIPFGKYAQRSLEEVGVNNLRSYVEYLERKAEKDKTPIKPNGPVGEFIERASNFIASFENGPIEGEETF